MHDRKAAKCWINLQWPMLAAACIALAFSTPADAQLLRGRLRPPPTEITAVAGQPYGVGKWTLELPPGVNPAILGNSGFTLKDKDNRVVFQAFEATPLRTVAREFLGRPQLATVYFLFTGSEPLNLTLYAPTAVAGGVTPVGDSVAHAKLLSEWWVQYTRQTNRIDRAADYPEIVDDYLLAMLSRRLSLPPASELPPPPIRIFADSVTSMVSGGQMSLPGSNRPDSELDQQAAMLFGSDSLRSAMHAQVMANRAASTEAADQPLPAGIKYTANVPEVVDKIAIEPLANRVPAECLYVRFGSFANYQWFRTTMQRWGGDLQNLISRRGLDFGLTSRIERQLVLKESALAPLLGPAVIADVAMIGTDTFFREGASIGMLFQARNNFALSTDFSGQRAEALKNVPGCKEEQVEIAGRKVSMLYTPDNRIRSFYAADGDFHLVTNSRYLVERFLATAGGKGALGSTAEFRFARSLLPAERDFTVFAYLSGEFLNNLIRPHYQIEMLRRVRSAAEIDMAMVAVLAARAEGRKASTLNDLIRGGFLPEGFGKRPDGSQLEMTDKGEFVDSLRGGRGSFAPVPDIDFSEVTATEAKHYDRFAEWFESKWAQLDPIVAGIQRMPGKTKDTERVILDVQLTPLALKNYESIASKLGPIQNQRMAPIPGDLAAVQIVASGTAAGGATNPPAQTPPAPSRLFGAIRDGAPMAAAPPPAAAPPNPGSQFRINGRPLLEGLPIGGQLGDLLGGGAQPAMALLPPLYFGSYPHPGVLNSLGFADAPLDAAGYGRGPMGLWIRQVGSFTFASPDRSILEVVPPQVRYVEAARPGQAWIDIGDLSNSKLSGTINGIFYRLAKNATIGDVRFLQSLTTQLRVPPQEALEVAERLADAKFVSSIGGKFQLEDKSGALSTWVSTVLPGDRMRLIDGLFESAPADFTAPVLEWLRSLSADLALDNRTLSLHAEVEMKSAGLPSSPPAAAPPSFPSLPKLPSFPSLGSPEKSKPPAKPEPTKPDAEELPPPPPRPAAN